MGISSPSFSQYTKKQTYTTMASLPPYDITLDEMSVALSYISLTLGAGAPPAPAPAPAKKDNKKQAKKEKAAPKKKEEEEDDDDFDVFGDDDEEEKPKEAEESRAEKLARLKREAEERTAKKEAKQRTLVGIEIKPWDTEQDLMELWKKVTTTIVQPGLKWGEGCTLVEIAFGIKKIVTTFVMGKDNSSDDIVEAIQAMEDEVQSVEVTSMNVL